jgi:hypothetical protein
MLMFTKEDMGFYSTLQMVQIHGKHMNKALKHVIELKSHTKAMDIDQNSIDIYPKP